MLQELKCYTACLSCVKFNQLVLIIWGVQWNPFSASAQRLKNNSWNLYCDIYIFSKQWILDLAKQKTTKNDLLYLQNMKKTVWNLVTKKHNHVLSFFIFISEIQSCFCYFSQNKYWVIILPSCLKLYSVYVVKKYFFIKWIQPYKLYLLSIWYIPTYMEATFQLG